VLREEKMKPYNTLVYRVTSYSIIGREKGEIGRLNEDCKIVDKHRLIFAVADGISQGGLGDLASSLACAYFEVEAIKIRKGLRNGIIKPGEVLDLMKQVLKEASKVVMGIPHEQSRDSPGCTFDGCLIYNDTAYICHCGDSRVYYFDRQGLRLLTEDHKLMPESLPQNEREMWSIMYSGIYSYLGLTPEEMTIDIFKQPLEPGSVLFVATDGVTNLITRDELEKILSLEDTKEMKSSILALVKKPQGMARWYASVKGITFEQAQRRLRKKDDATFIIIKVMENAPNHH